LFNCNSSGTCKRIIKIGYYVNDRNNVYYCNNRNDGKCTKTVAETSCISSTIGKIYFNSENISVICLNYDGQKGINKILENSGSERYIVNYNSDNIYGLTSDKVAIVKINKSYVVLSTSGNF